MTLLGAAGGEVMRIGEVRRWTFDAALPYWRGAGVDRDVGGFVEHLDLDGRDALAPFKRVRAQARQIYVYSHATLLGAGEGADEVADAGWRFLTRHGRRADGGWVRRLDRGGGVLDPTCDAYDMAFVLFAHAWRYRVRSEPEVLASALDTVAALDRLLRHPGGLGWLAEEGDCGPRQQNPHMHLLEAAVELALATGHPRFHELARDIADLFRTRLFEDRTGTLREFFAEDWSTLPGQQGRLVEPGHQFEWAWLLFRAEPVIGYSLRDQARALCDSAERFGRIGADGSVIDLVNDEGAIVSADARLWPQTEALKANLALFEHEAKDTRRSIGQSVSILLDRYLATAPRGTWIDHLTATGLPRVDKIPSTSFYHLFLAFSELMRLETALLALPCVDSVENEMATAGGSGRGNGHSVP